MFRKQICLKVLQWNLFLIIKIYQNTLCRVYERNDKYCCYGEDVQLITRILTAIKVKTIGSDEDSLNYVSITKAHLVQALRHLLFVIQYKVEILRNSGSARSPQWTIVGKASPGDLAAVEDFLFSDDNSYVMTRRGLMAVKVSAKGNEMFVDNPQFTTLQSVIVQLSPQECLLPSLSKSKQSEIPVEEILKSHNISVTEYEEFNDQFIIQDLNRLLQFEEGQNFQNSKKDESDMKVALCSVAALIKYLQLLSDENNFSHFVLSVFKSELFAKVDLSCEIGLGLFPEVKSDFHSKAYLFGHLNSCFTSAEERLDIVEAFVQDSSTLNEISKLINKFIDIEMLCRKIQRRKAGLQMLMKLPLLKDALLKYAGPHADVLKENFINVIQERIEECTNFTSMISQTLDFDAIENKEFVIVAKYDETLFDLHEQMSEVKNLLLKELDLTKEDIGIPSVKLESFEKLGYTFRLTLKEENFLRNKKGYVIIDTRSSGVRFQSPDLRELNEQYNTLRKDYEEIQKKIVSQIVEISASYIQSLRLLNASIAWLDASLALAHVATNATKTYVRPKLREKGECHIVLKQCRHPYLEDTLRSYIPNDVDITKEKHRFYFVTGPNMGGKSTYIYDLLL
ncbi:DNA mismatch repair protein Msh2 [Caerostris extrusa]|uniref:DNA mismatch repair protein Msh2 n=1 Tax=Caerostris extrusa TaxID=172846 RepID=A0AAV4MVH2_CAEEX|nr:DNA mismatch repair protein Msh2 [Caerostris extrusa]